MKKFKSLSYVTYFSINYKSNGVSTIENLENGKEFSPRIHPYTCYKLVHNLFIFSILAENKAAVRNVRYSVDLLYT